MRRCWSWISLLLVFGTGCGDSDLPDAYKLEGFRVIALVADQPESDPGATVSISPVLSDLLGEGRAITYSAQGCLDPGVGYGANPTCEGTPTKTVLATDAPVTGLVAPAYTGMVTSSLNVALPSAAIIFAQASERDQFNGVDYLVTFEFVPTGGPPVRAFRRIAVSTKAIKNQNPVFEAIPLLAGNAAFSEFDQEDVVVRPDLTPSSLESYEEIRQDGEVLQKTETLETSWYISNGDLTPSITDQEDSTTLTPPEDWPTSHPVVVAAVTRDGRGGVAVTTQSF